uniref:Conserved domain protein n=1 Tax=Haemonchus contortus TaxID=6289 RepID=A0A7I4YVL3_HAECO
MTKNVSKMAKLSYKGRSCLPKPRGDMSDEFNRLAPKFAIPFGNQKKKVTTALGTTANYGCNGIFDKKNTEKDCIIVGCLFSSAN